MFGRFTDWVPSEFRPFRIDPVVNLFQTVSLFYVTVYNRQSTDLIFGESNDRQAE